MFVFEELDAACSTRYTKKLIKKKSAFVILNKDKIIRVTRENVYYLL